MLDLGFVSAILAEKSLEEVLNFASENKFKCVEIMCWPKGKAERRYAGVTHIDVDKLNKSAVEHIKVLQEATGVYISGLGYYPNPLDPDEEKSDFYLSHLKKVIDAAVLLGIPVVNTFIGRNPATSVEDNFKVFEKRWPPIIQYASDNGIKVGIENCPMFFTMDEWPGGKNLATTPEIWDRMFNLIPDPNFGLNYDPSHLIWQQMDEIAVIYDYHSRFHHVHLKDVKVYQDKLNNVGIMATPLEYHQPKIPGLGDVRWSDFFSALTTVGYRGPVCIEVEDRAFEASETDIVTSILQSRNYVSQFLNL